MSAQVKKAGRIGTKIVAAFLFLFLVMFNVEVGLYDGEKQESGILGMVLNVFVTEADASSQYCWVWNEDWFWCESPAINCMCTVVVVADCDADC